MLRFIFSIPLLVGTISVSAGCFSSDQNQLPDSVASQIISLMNASNIPGCVISVVSDTSVIYQQSFGYSDLERKQKVSLYNSQFFAGSVSKLITATAVVKAIEQGYLHDSYDIGEYAPDLSIKKSFEDNITVKNLLSHTSGLDLTSVGRKTKLPGDMVDLEDFLRKFLPDQVLHPDQEMLYCNQAVALSAYLVENSTGSSFHQYLRNNIFIPLEMSKSTFEYTEDMPGVCKGYNKKGIPQDIYLNNDWPAQMLLTTAPDMANFMIMHLNNGMFKGKEVLKKPSVELMHKQYFTYDSQLPGICLGFFEDNYEGNRSLWHDGSFTGFRTLCYLVPGRKFGLFISNNGENSSFNWAVLDKFLSSLITTEETFPVMISSGTDEGIAGEYQSNRYSRSSFIKLAGLFERTIVKVGKDSLIEYSDQLYYRVSPLNYRSTLDNKLIVFGQAKNGRINALYTAYPMMRKFSKIKGWQKTWVQLSIFITALILSFASLFILHRSRTLRRNPGTKSFKLITFIQQGSQFLAIILLLAGFITSNEQDFTLNHPPFLIMLSMAAGVVLLISILPQLALLFVTLKHYSPKLKLFFLISTLTTWGYLLFLYNWNLLGFMY